MKYYWAILAGLGVYDTARVYAKVGADHILFAICLGMTLTTTLFCLSMSMSKKTSV